YFCGGDRGVSVIVILALHDALPICCPEQRFAMMRSCKSSRLPFGAVWSITSGSGSTIASGIASERTSLPHAASAMQTTRHLMPRSEEHTSELQSRENLVCRLLLEQK